MSNLVGRMRAENAAAENEMLWARKEQINPKTNEQYYFIQLVLRNTGRTPKDHFAVSGFEDLVPVGEPQLNTESGEPEYAFLMNRSGYTQFRKQADGTWRFDMVDTLHNRQFLASHYATGYWDIVNPDYDRDIRDRYEKMEADLKKHKESPFYKKIKKMQDDIKEADEAKQPRMVQKMHDAIAAEAEDKLPTKERQAPKKRLRRREYQELPPEKPESIIEKEKQPPQSVEKPEKDEEVISTSLVEVKNEHK